MPEILAKPRYWGTSEANRKRVWSAESRLKDSLSLLGNQRGRCLKPKIAEANRKRVWKDSSRLKTSLANTGKVRTLEMRKRLSEAKRGEKSPSWRGGITPINRAIRGSLDYKLWREAIFKRDNFTCQECGERGGSLHAHHIKPFAYFPELRFAIDNGLTLCVSCHEKTENYKKKLKQYE